MIALCPRRFCPLPPLRALHRLRYLVADFGGLRQFGLAETEVVEQKLNVGVIGEKVRHC